MKKEIGKWLMDIAKYITTAILGLRVKYAPGKGFNQLNFIPL